MASSGVDGVGCRKTVIIHLQGNPANIIALALCTLVDAKLSLSVRSFVRSSVRPESNWFLRLINAGVDTSISFWENDHLISLDFIGSRKNTLLKLD